MNIKFRRVSVRIWAVAGLAALALAGCRGPRMSVADAQMERGEYFEASATYRKLYNKLKRPSQRAERAEAAYKMGLADEKLMRFSRAAGAYRSAMRYGYPDSTALLRLGHMLHAQGQWGEAVKAYEAYLEWQPGNLEARTALEGARRGAAMKQNPTRYRVGRHKLINSGRADYAPAYADASHLYYTSTSERATGTGRSEVTGTRRADIWTTSRDENGAWTRPVAAAGGVNTDAEEGTPAFSPDGNTMYFTRSHPSANGPTWAEIWTASRSEAQWSEPRRLELIEDTAHSYAHPAVSPDGRWLYFVSDRPGGFGSTDIWRIDLNASGAVAENLGPTVNTQGREMFPTLRADTLLYFSSDGHAGMGGLDIYRAKRNRFGAWEVSHMGAPLNSEADDFGMAFEPGGREAGFFSSNRGDARGYDHIYTFELPDLRITIGGYVTDTEEEPIAGATVRVVGRDGTMRRTATRPDGSFELPLDRGTAYTMLATAKGYMNARQEFVTDTADADADYGVDFILASLTEPNVVENIFYDFDRATLRPESTAALDTLAATLRQNPDVTVEMGSHTDRVGTEAYNLRLSDRRAKAVVDYLVSVGIDPARLSWRGYGKSQPKRVTRRVARLYPQFPEGTLLDEAFVDTLEEADREAADQINRRTEFRVTGTNIR